ncbi:hypothetical protein FOMPIDRAFT_152840 [Fomitopsis schrenkii]|uniref:Uncharacterized protein n=1 Tax=Fomitopsis schrenkii TaxID=2126942 RepID=S8DPN9_FOMSC|nr:hypothetical protein FOMPIDRAFT_152840 [Fomitopsis schrenkii]
MAQLLNQLGSSLTTLLIRSTANGLPLNLSRNLGLETLQILIGPRLVRDELLWELGGAGCQESLLPMLASLHNATRLRRLWFTIWVHPLHEYEGSFAYKGRMDWKSLNNLATYRQYEHLQEVVVNVRYQSIHDTESIHDTDEQFLNESYNEVKRGLQELVWYSRGLVRILMDDPMDSGLY